MGIRFTDSILALLAAISFVFIAYSAGHALSSEHTWAWAAAGGFAVLSAVIGAFAVFRIRGYARSRGEETHT